MKEMATHSSSLAWEIPWRRSLVDRGAWWATVHEVTRVGHDLVTKPPHLYIQIYMYTHTQTHMMEYYSKKNEIVTLVATWMDLDITVLSEVSHRKTSIIWYYSYVESNHLKSNINELI